ncbi:YifB family Mg chelatase-like AAA ATPase [Neisseria gonorrhoeae]|uniref:YifB family Mg chelatase-like AAA ATPase n=1 Tax=Neisseria gonorrhoeae TaxID=485 RepID=UPI0010AB5666|nr:YifB family Mg chelatase-like AAA ATPase [Neisseria gonorrhoeae]TJW37114.1 ATP-binding protein [Neisseria gonorrhoeae]
MSLALVYSRALSGMNAPLVEVEAHLANGLPHFNIVGLPDTEVKESRDRVRAAIIQSGFEFPAKKITVNLAPADLPKESGRFDLPIAIGILAASGQVAPEKLAEYEFAGELALSGLLRPVRGALAMAWQGMQAKRAFVLPEENAGQAAVMRGITVYGARSLGEVAAHLNGIEPLAQTECSVPQMPSEHGGQPDLCDVKGQHSARLALEIAAAGGHSLLMMGPPGTGKSMLSQRLPGILPPLAEDELPEFDRKVLEVLREPLENGEIHISRAARQAVYPAKFQLVAAMNPCPCGYLGHPVKPCRCTPESVARYRSKISGPLLDRIDLTIEVPSLSAAELMQQEAGESSASVLERVIAARGKQYARQGKVNAALSVSELDSQACIQKEAQEALGSLLEKLSLSARSFHRIMRVARTLADLAGDEEVGRSHVMKAIGFRRAL